MDGVLVDSEPRHNAADCQTFKHFGVTLDEEILNGFTGMDIVVSFTRMKEKFNIQAPVEELISMKNNLFKAELHRNIPKVDGVNEMINKISDLSFARALASSSCRDIVDTVLNGLQLQDWFDVTVAGDEVIRAKPDPAIFLKAAELLKIEVSDCVVIEDSRNGVSAAKDAGMRIIGFRNPSSGNQDLSKAEVITDSLRDIPEIIRGLWG